MSCKRKTLTVAFIILAIVFFAGYQLNQPVHSIFPYAIAVIVIAMCFGSMFGILVSLAATGVAWTSGAFPTVPENIGLEFDEALITLTELALVAVIASTVAKYRSTK